jgi:hypothetical protein
MVERRGNKLLLGNALETRRRNVSKILTEALPFLPEFLYDKLLKKGIPTQPSTEV